MALFTKARTTFAAELGPDHPDTLMSMFNLTISYRNAGQYDRALKLREETLAFTKAKLGPDHPLTAACLEGQAQALANRGQLDRAGTILDQLIAS
jgi:hypothetical protein